MTTLPHVQFTGVTGSFNVPIEPGIQIDGSHGTADDLNRRIIKIAQDCGMPVTDTIDQATLTIWDDPKLRALLPHISDQAEGRMSEWLTEQADEAVVWLNDHTTGDYTWLVSESSLFLVADAELDGGV